MTSDVPLLERFGSNGETSKIDFSKEQPTPLRNDFRSVFESPDVFSDCVAMRFGLQKVVLAL